MYANFWRILKAVNYC